jgi:hypothetical protein
MASDTTTLYFGTTLRLDGVNDFYQRRVMQRCERGEITLVAAAALLLAAAKRREAQTAIVGVQTRATRA